MRRSLAGLAMLVIAGGVTLLSALTLRAQAGDDTPPRGQFGGMQRVTGEVTTVSGANLTVKGEDGASYQVVTTDNTRVMKRAGGGGTTIKVADLKAGDGVTAMGNLDAPNKTMHAAMVFAMDAAEVKKMKENLGKTFISGKVTAIDLDNAKMTVQRPDGVAQTIGFDETTSFKRGRPGRGGLSMTGEAGGTPTVATGESITLADIKVGDNVSGAGSVKAGTFVPTVLTVATPGQGRHRDVPAGGTTPAPATTPGPGY